MIAGCSFSDLMNSGGMVPSDKDEKAMACTLSMSVGGSTKMAKSQLVAVALNSRTYARMQLSPIPQPPFIERVAAH